MKWTRTLYWVVLVPFAALMLFAVYKKFVQSPVGDALTHVGQIVLLRRIAGFPVNSAPYFTAEIVPGEIENI